MPMRIGYVSAMVKPVATTTFRKVSSPVVSLGFSVRMTGECLLVCLGRFAHHHLFWDYAGVGREKDSGNEVFLLT